MVLQNHNYMFRLIYDSVIYTYISEPRKKKQIEDSVHVYAAIVSKYFHILLIDVSHCFFRMWSLKLCPSSEQMLERMFG